MFQSTGAPATGQCAISRVRRSIHSSSSKGITPGDGEKLVARELFLNGGLEPLTKPAQRADRLKPRASAKGRCPGFTAPSRYAACKAARGPGETGSRISSGLSGRGAYYPLFPGHRPSAEALGCALPARWAGFC
jgi:hypothetical protein